MFLGLRLFCFSMFQKEHQPAPILYWPSYTGKQRLCNAWPPLQSVNSSSLLPRGRFVALGYVIKKGKSVLVSSSESGSPWRCYNFLVCSAYFLDKAGTTFHMKHWSTWSGQLVQVTQIQSLLVCHGGGTATLPVNLAVVSWSQPTTALPQFVTSRAVSEEPNATTETVATARHIGEKHLSQEVQWTGKIESQPTFGRDKKQQMINEIWPKLQFCKSAGYSCDMSLGHFFGVPLKCYICLTPLSASETVRRFFRRERDLLSSMAWKKHVGHRCVYPKYPKICKVSTICSKHWLQNGKLIHIPTYYPDLDSHHLSWLCQAQKCCHKRICTGIASKQTWANQWHPSWRSSIWRLHNEILKLFVYHAMLCWAPWLSTNEIWLECSWSPG